jgi:dCMP deaminase
MQSASKTNGRNRLNWPETAMRLAQTIAACRSEDTYVQVGACAVRYNKTVALGYNGAPSGITIDWSNRDERRKRVLHAEANVLNYCMPDEVEFIAVTHLPCPECLKLIAQKRIKTVFYDKIPENYDTELTFMLAKEFEINLIPIEQS